MSNIDRRQLLHCAPALALAAPLLVSRACGQDRYPSRPITLILPYPAGGGTDVIARVFARTLEQELGGTVVVVNKTGAGGNIATDAAANAKPDGYTLLIGNQGPMVVNPHLYKKLASDPAAMLEPISLIAEASLVIVVARKL